MYSYLTNDDYVYNKENGIKKCIIKRKIKFKNYKKCLENNEKMLRSKQRFKSEVHNVFTEKVNKIAVGSNIYFRLQTLDGITSYQYSAGTGKTSKTELSKYTKMKN